MDGIIDLLTWWDSCCALVLVAQAYTSPAVFDVDSTLNWHNHTNQILELKQQLENLSAFQYHRQEELYFGDGVVYESELEEITRLEEQKERLEEQIIEEQKADVREQRKKAINRIVYPTAIIIGANLALGFGAWALTKAAALFA